MASVINFDRLPALFPTDRHDAPFWEMLGRTVATFGFLEEVLGKAIFAYTATRPYAEDEIDAAYEKWLPQLERALTDPLGNLIDAYGKVVREHPSARVENLDELLEDLKQAAALRNVLCHGSWRVPDETGAALPFYVNRQKLVFNTAIDRRYLLKTQRHVAELACAVINTVTHMGWQFPGSGGPGAPVVS